MTRTTLIASCAPPVIVAVDFAIASVVVPEMRPDLALSDGEVRWIFTGYSLGFGALLLAAGRWADAYGRRRILIAGLALFATSAVAVSTARTGETVIAARCLQGAGAAMMSPAALSMLTATTRDGAERSRATAAYGIAIAIGFVTGTLASGALATLATWRLATALAVPLCLAAVFAAWRVQLADGGDSTIAVGRAASVAVACLVGVGAVAATVAGWPGIVVPAAATVTLLLLAGRLGRSLTGMRRPLASACAAGLAVTGTGVAATLLITLHLQDELGYSPLGAGLAFACFGAAAVPGARAARRIATTRPPGSLIGSGLVAQGTAFVAAAAAASGGATVAIIACLAGFGFGHVIGNASVAALATAGAPTAVHGVLAGMLITAQYLGGALGPPLVSQLAGDVGSFRAGMALCGATAVAAGALAWLILRDVRWPEV